MDLFCPIKKRKKKPSKVEYTKLKKFSLLPWLPKRPKKQNPVPPKKLMQDWVFRLKLHFLIVSEFPLQFHCNFYIEKLPTVKKCNFDRIQQKTVKMTPE